ncbi:MAG: permease [Geopsychrobacter sp.]|nr:permease [Geopsychrobacter sp.]
MDFLEIAKELLLGIWNEFVYILPFIALGVLLEATIRTLKWHLKIRHALTRFGGLANILATLLGAVSPLCACATLPLVISLLLAGLPLAPAMALLVTSPLMSPAGYTLLNWELGPAWANAVVVCAILFGLFAGYLTMFMRRYGFVEELIFKKTLPEGNFHDPDYPVEELRCDCGKQLSHRVDRCTHSKFLVFLAKFWEGMLKIGKFALLGVVIEVMAVQFLPTEWVSGILEGGGVLPIFALTFATIPMHLQQVTAAAMLYGFVSPEFGDGITLSRGAGIALLVGGPVTALPVMALFIAMFKKRVLALYLAICISGTLLLAFGYRALPFF